MASTVPSSNSPVITQRDSTAPLWHLVHFDVRCARCGYDLRGQTDPLCPACWLEFTWSDAVPLEQLTCGKCNYHLYGLTDSRCPECGTNVDWNAALLRYRTAQKPLFEYRWRERPIRSLCSTWFLALRPSRLWRMIDIHDPPQRGPLIVWIFLMIFLAAFCLPLAIALGASAKPFVSSTVSGGVSAPILWQMSRRFGEYFLHFARNPSTYAFVPFLAMWWLFSFGALMVFRQSMRRCKVKTIHVFRTCAYSLATSLPPLCFLSFLLAILIPPRVSRGGRIDALSMFFVFELYFYVGVLFLLHILWSIRTSYKHYIRMPHSWGVAIASQAIAILATIAIPPAVLYLVHGGW